MSEMVERVARAIHDEWYSHLGEIERDESWKEMRGTFYPATARAAIEAMREPTEEMRVAGMSPFMAAHDTFYIKNEPCGPIYRAMIDAALLSKQEG